MSTVGVTVAVLFMVMPEEVEDAGEAQLSEEVMVQVTTSPSARSSGRVTGSVFSFTSASSKGCKNIQATLVESVTRQQCCGRRPGAVSKQCRPLDQAKIIGNLTR